MPHRKIQAGDWVVVCDGGKFLILENAGDDMYPNLRMKETKSQEPPLTHDQGRAVHGRAPELAYSVHSAAEGHNVHDAVERSFLEALAARLDSALSHGETKRLILAAPPRALGMIRHAYSDKLRGALRAEIDKDFTKLPIYEIEKHVLH
jgi:protein required for attachment to host cells